MTTRFLPLLLLLSLLATACGGVVQFELGDPADFVQQPQTSVVVASDGEVLAELHTDEDRRDVSLDDVADIFETAVVAVEDRRFLLHHGVDAAAIVRAFQANLESGEIEQGGSTITQQYVKNTITGTALTLERKVQEAVAAWQLEDQYTKAQILERYLNTVYFGKGAYGVRAASLRFFGVEPAELGLDQAALLAGLINSPTRFDPFDNPEESLSRRERVLTSMVEVGAITREEADEAAGMALDLAPLTEDRSPAPFIVEEVKRIIRDDQNGDLASALGATPDERVTALFTGGFEVVTTLDPAAQAIAEAAVAAQLIPDGPSAAVVVLDPLTGAIRAMVGGKDFYDEADPVARFNLATQGRRQPGSSFKPFLLAAALERGITLDRVFPGGACISFEQFDPVWSPCNYGGASYASMTLREATVRSVNTVYAALGVELSPSGIIAAAQSFGIRSSLPAVPSLALGTGEVTPLEMAGAYSVFANLGTYTAPYLIQSITGPDGTVLYRADPLSYRVVEESTAFLVTQTLSDVVARGTGVRAQIGRPQAGKTGTSQDSADAWFVGYTPDLVAAVWVGFPEGRLSMTPPRTSEVIEGGRWPAEIWSRMMTDLLADTPPTAFPIPAIDLVTLEVDGLRNCLPNPYTPPDLIESREYLSGTQPTQRCTEPTGPPVDDVPNVVGLPLDVAQTLLTDRGFALDVRPVSTRRFPPGIVAFQRPGAGETTLAVDGNAVVLWVSQLVRATAVVADVREVQVADAIAILESDGWVVFIERACPATGCTGDSTRVWGSGPEAGAQQTQFGIVTLFVEPVIAAPSPTETPTQKDTATDIETGPSTTPESESPAPTASPTDSPTPSPSPTPSESATTP